jgi:predicted RNA-binding protein with TRAM domain
MEISDQLRCLFSGRVEQAGQSYRIEVPAQELDIGELEAGETYRVAILSSASAGGSTSTGESDADADGASEGRERRRSRGDSEYPKPPVEEGETRNVEIENLGDQGDGITRVEHGFVVIVPDTEQGERVTIEITDVRQNVAFAEVVERLSYYE